MSSHRNLSLPRNYTRTVLPTYTCTCGSTLDAISATNGYLTLVGTTQTSRLFVQCPTCSAMYVREESYIPLFPSQPSSEAGTISSPPPPPPPNSPDYSKFIIPEISSCDTVPLCHSPRNTSPPSPPGSPSNYCGMSRFSSSPKYDNPFCVSKEWTAPHAPYRCICGGDLVPVKPVGLFPSEGLYTCRTCGRRMYYSKPNKQPIW